MSCIDVDDAPLRDVDDPVKRGDEVSGRQRARQEIADPAKRTSQTQFHAHQRVDHGVMRDGQQCSRQTLALGVGNETPS